MAVHRRGMCGLVLLWKLSWQRTWIAQRVIWVEPQDSHCNFIQLHSLWSHEFQFICLYLCCLCEVIQHLPLCFHLSNMSRSDLGSRQCDVLPAERVTDITTCGFWSLSSLLPPTAQQWMFPHLLQFKLQRLGSTALYISLLGFFSFFLINQSPSGFVNIQELSGPSLLPEVLAWE